MMYQSGKISGPKKGRWEGQSVIWEKRLTAESVQGAALAFQSVDNVHGGDGLPLGMLSVGDGISDDILKENFQDTTGLFVDETWDTFDTTSASKPTDGGLCDTLDVITQNFAVTLGASLSKTFASFATSRHDFRVLDVDQNNAE